MRDLFRSPRFLAALLVVCVTALFAWSVTDSHLNLDDWGYTAGCAFVRGGLTGGNIKAALCDFGQGGIWMPLTFLTYMADFSIGGGGWRLHHAVNVVFHALNALLVFAFLRALLGSRVRPWIAALAALLWAIHPMRVEAVTWIASRKEELWTLFGLAGLLLWMRHFQRADWRSYGAANICFLCALLAKPTAVCLPLVAYVTARFVRPDRPRRLLRHLPILIGALVVGLIALHSQANPTGREAVDLADTTVSWRLLNAGVSLGLYLVHLVWPVGLHLDYRAVFGGWPLQAELGLATLIGAILVFGFTPRLVRPPFARRLVPFAVLSALLTLLPVLGLLGVTGDKAYADRYLYFPSVFLTLILAGALELLARHNGRLANILAVLLILVETVLTVPTIRAFACDRTIYARVLADDPDHWRALRVLGADACARENRLTDGIALLRRSQRLRPSAATTAALAYVLACRGEKGDFDEVRRLGAAVSRNPSRDREGLLLDALAIVAFRTGDDAEAIRLFGAALTAPQRSHGNLHAMLNFGFALGNEGRLREALDILDKLKDVSDEAVRRRARAAAADLRRGVFSRFVWQP